MPLYDAGERIDVHDQHGVRRVLRRLERVDVGDVGSRRRSSSTASRCGRPLPASTAPDSAATPIATATNQCFFRTSFSSQVPGHPRDRRPPASGFSRCSPPVATSDGQAACCVASRHGGRERAWTSRSRRVGDHAGGVIRDGRGHEPGAARPLPRPHRAAERRRSTRSSRSTPNAPGPRPTPPTPRSPVATRSVRCTGCRSRSRTRSRPRASAPPAARGELTDHVPAADAPAVARLKDAGAIVFGKTNLPRWSADFQTYNDLFGITSNPWDLGRTTGGSSGGAAAAVAAGFTSFELGTDIGGSVRIPAHCCGVFGLKPSFGRDPAARLPRPRRRRHDRRRHQRVRPDRAQRRRPRPAARRPRRTRARARGRRGSSTSPRATRSRSPTSASAPGSTTPASPIESEYARRCCAARSIASPTRADGSTTTDRRSTSRSSASCSSA